MHSFSSFSLVLHDICLVIAYFASFTDYENDIFKVISNWHVEGYKFAGKVNKFGGKSNKKFKIHKVHGVQFFAGLTNPLCSFTFYERRRRPSQRLKKSDGI